MSDRINNQVEPAVDEGWFKGRFRGKTGLVPGNYLEFIKDEPAIPKYAPSRRVDPPQQTNNSPTQPYNPPISHDNYNQQTNIPERAGKMNKHSMRAEVKNRSGEIVKEQMERHKQRSASNNSMLSNSNGDDGGIKLNPPEQQLEKPTRRPSRSPEFSGRSVQPSRGVGGLGDIMSGFQQRKEEDGNNTSKYGEDGKPIVAERPPILKSNQTYEPPAPVSRGFVSMVNRFQQDSSSNSNIPSSRFQQDSSTSLNAPTNKGVGDLVNRLQDSAIDTQRIIAAKKPAPPPPKPKPKPGFYNLSLMYSYSFFYYLQCNVI